MIEAILRLLALHDTGLVLLAGAICLFGCHSALTVLARAETSTGRTHAMWLTAAAMLGGASVWTTHFLAMLAFSPGTAIGYDVGTTLVSIVIAVASVAVAFWIYSRLRRPIIGGILFGLAVTAMHYAGMSGMSTQGGTHWNSGYVVASVFLGLALGALGLRISFNTGRGARRLLAGIVLGLSVITLHFTGMLALTIEHAPAMAFADGSVPAPDWLSIALVLTMAVVIILGLAGAAIDEHVTRRAIADAQRLRAYVAELEHTQAELEKTTADLQKALHAAASASQAKSQFLATMSHELRTPLNAIIGFSEILSQELFGKHSNPQYREYAQNIEDSGKHLLHLITDILDFSRIDAGRLELADDSVDVVDLTKRSVRMIAAQASANSVQLSMTGHTREPWVRADERRMRQILLNLLSNAVKFTPRGGSVTVSVELHDSGIEIAVSDTGIGMSEDEIPLALQRFTQIANGLARQQDGAGLGLPLAIKLVEMHGGHVDIESQPGAGTTVRVMLPPDRIIEQPNFGHRIAQGA